MNGLDHILKSETENLQELTDTAVKHTESMWEKTSRSHTELEEKGKAFLNNTSMVS